MVLKKWKEREKSNKSIKKWIWKDRKEWLKNGFIKNSKLMCF